MKHRLPPLLSEIAEEAGLGAALALAEAAGGERRAIPAPERLKADHWLMQAVGPEAAKKIALRFCGTVLEIPRGPLGTHNARIKRQIAEMIAAGATNNEIARATGVVFKTVQRHRNRRDDGQGSLF